MCSSDEAMKAPKCYSMKDNLSNYNCGRYPEGTLLEDMTKSKIF